jgi:hypothetical protein
MNNRWHKYDEGRSINKISKEGGVILRDDEHELGARITLKRGKDFVSVSGHIYGWTDHTRFFVNLPDAEREYEAMKNALGDVVNVIEAVGSKDIKVWEAISEFVRRFP